MITYLNKAKNKKIMRFDFWISFIAVSFLFTSIIYPQNKINFSAKSLETIIENDIEKQIFKEDVVITKNKMKLYTDKAIYYPEKNEVFLVDDVKMYDQGDSLFCDSLILYDTEYKKFEALKNVHFYQSNNEIICGKLKYETLQDTSKKMIRIYEDGEIIDSQRKVKGDSIFIHYEDDVIKHINILSNGEILNYKYAKINVDNKSQLIEDYISSKKMSMNFFDNDSMHINLKGMAITKFNVVQDTLLEGLNQASGDSITIDMKNDMIHRMQIIGGAEGQFIPEKNNSRIDSTIIYRAEYIDYLVKDEKSYLFNNAYLDYDFTELNSGEIVVDWKQNYLEAKIKDSIYPSINGFGENPTYGDSMIFNLVTKRGKIFKAKTEYNDSYYTGDNIIRDDNSILYVQDSKFTSCDNESPHYFFHSDYMKMIPNDRVIAKPVIFHLQDLPIFYLPFAVFPNKNGDRISGWIMPSFGNRKSTGTYLEDLGYYYVFNDYSDYRILVDIQDKRGIITDQLFRYKRLAGKKWYNYYLDGHIEIGKKYYLADDDNDISNLFNEETSIYNNIKWKHKQSFDPTQDLIINYKYKSDIDMNELNFNERLDQNQLTSLSYQKRWERNSLSIGFEKYLELYIPVPDDSEQINVYKWLSGPRVSFNLPQRKLFGNGENWYNNIYINYGFTYNDGKETFTKNSICVDDDCTDFEWGDDESDISSGGAVNNIQFSSTHSIGWMTLSPRLSIREDWVMSYRDYNDTGEYEELNGFKRRFSWNSSMSLNTKIYGVFPIDIGRVNSMRHKMTPSITLNYTPDLLAGSNQIVTLSDGSDVDILSGTSATSLSKGYESFRFSLDNAFQMKVRDQYNDISKIDFLNYYLTFNYGKSQQSQSKNSFSLIDSKISFKKPNGSELLYVHMQHDLYQRDDTGIIILDNNGDFKFNSNPRLTTLTAQMSTFFRISGKSIGSNTEKKFIETASEDTLDTSNYNSILYMDEYKPNISNQELWRSDLSFSILGNYDTDNKKWDFNYFNLDTRTTFHLTKKWLFTYAVGVNLIDMKIRSQSLKFYRDLHCWEFMFTWWPDGFGKGFQLSINIKHPDLKDVRLRSSSPNRTFMMN